METKKYPAVDVEARRPLIFLFSFSVSVALAIIAFEWRSEVKPLAPRTLVFDVAPMEVMEIPATTQEHRIAPPQPLNRQIASSVPIPTSTEADLVLTDDIPELMPDEPVDFTLSPEVIEPEPAAGYYLLAEVAPEPLGGFKSMYTSLSKSIRYPQRARMAGTEGKVLVEFIVGKDGTPEDLKVLQGIGSGCDEEAMRVLAATRWQAGRQRGKPVRVRMVLPVYFKLSF